MGASRPLTGTCPIGSAPVSPSLHAASHTTSEIRSCEPICLFSCSMREAKLTTSPMTVYYFRRADPMLPVTASPAWRPMPTRVGRTPPDETSSPPAG